MSEATSRRPLTKWGLPCAAKSLGPNGQPKLFFFAHTPLCPVWQRMFGLNHNEIVIFKLVSSYIDLSPIDLFWLVLIGCSLALLGSACLPSLGSNELLYSSNGLDIPY